MQLIHWVGREQLGRCPTAVTVIDGVPIFIINRDVWPQLPEFSRRFTMAHEVGHWLFGGDESMADAFALGLLEGKDYKSLKKSLRCLRDLQVPYERFEKLYNLCVETANKH